MGDATNPIRLVHLGKSTSTTSLLGLAPFSYIYLESEDQTVILPPSLSRSSSARYITSVRFRGIQTVKCIK